MKHRGIVRLAGAVPALLGLAAGQASAAPAAKPNIIFILSDDVGLGNIGCYGGPFKTPHIDALAKSGIRFDLGYSTPLCGPSRAQALTGRYPFRTGHISNQSANSISPADEVMIPTVMETAGYATLCAGKWGQLHGVPADWGFDESLIFLGGKGRYWSGPNTAYLKNGQELNYPENTYFPDVLHQFITDFIVRNQNRPFFVYYPIPHCHGPIEATPDSRPGGSADQHYIDTVEYMDTLVGRLVAELDRLKLREKTLIIFTGDNGTARQGVEMATVHGRAISGQKGTMLEGGSRVPLIASWPGTTPAGVVSRDLVDFSDFFPTFAELGGAAAPAGVKIDGRSFAAPLLGKKGTPREWIYVELKGESYVRNAGYKLTNRGELFDMKNAPYEEIPVPADTTDVKAIAARLALQEVLDRHPAGDPSKIQGKKKAKGGKKAALPGGPKRRAKKAAAQP